MNLLGKVIRWLAREQIMECEMIAYQRGWEDGVAQQRHDPQSTEYYESFDEEGRPWSQNEWWILGVE